MPQIHLTRRDLLLGAVGVAGAAATGWALMSYGGGPEGAARLSRIAPTSEVVRRAEQRRRAAGTGRTVRATLTARPGKVDLGGRVVPTWAYDGQAPGHPIRCQAGDHLEVDVVNRLPEPTTVHWHGIRLRNDMDGVPHLTQQAIAPGQRMRYAFTAPDPGTYWLHPHVRLQRERGLFAPLIIDDPREHGDYDVEFVVVLDDWIDGAGATPDQVLAELEKGGMNSRYEAAVRAGKILDRSKSWQYHVPAKIASPSPGMTPMPVPVRLASAVDYPFYLLNGRLPTAPHTMRARPRQRARIRLINAGGATVFRVALGGHRLTVTHTDGFPVRPVTVETLQIASGERYDLLATLDDGAFPLVAVAEGKAAQALGVVRTASGTTPPATAAPKELAGSLLGLADLHATPDVRIEQAAPDVERTLYLTGDMKTFVWRINAETYHADEPFKGITPVPVRAGERARIAFVNQTPMYHPMHLHGHTFTVRSVGTSTGKTGDHLPTGTRKDTLMVPPGERITVDFTADNPGQWLVHCHNAYHLAAGMATIVSYQDDK